jgi:hypothetical protein
VTSLSPYIVVMQDYKETRTYKSSSIEDFNKLIDIAFNKFPCLDLDNQKFLKDRCYCQYSFCNSKIVIRTSIKINS